MEDRTSRRVARVWFWLACVAMAESVAAQAPAPKLAQPENLLLRWGGVLIVLVAIWFILYKVIYPFFLRYYKADFCKTIFWTLFLLYSATWLFLSSYVLLEYGFYFDWLKWVAAFLAVLWLMSAIGLLLRRNPA